MVMPGELVAQDGDHAECIGIVAVLGPGPRHVVVVGNGEHVAVVFVVPLNHSVRVLRPVGIRRVRVEVAFAVLRIPVD